MADIASCFESEMAPYVLLTSSYGRSFYCNLPTVLMFAGTPPFRLCGTDSHSGNYRVDLDNDVKCRSTVAIVNNINIGIQFRNSGPFRPVIACQSDRGSCFRSHRFEKFRKRTLEPRSVIVFRRLRIRPRYNTNIQCSMLHPTELLECTTFF